MDDFIARTRKEVLEFAREKIQQLQIGHKLAHENLVLIFLVPPFDRNDLRRVSTSRTLSR